MADMGDVERGRRRRRRGGGRKERSDREKDVLTTTTTKPPIILAKPPAERAHSVSADSSTSAKHQEKTVVMLKTREDPVRPASSSSPLSVLSDGSATPQAYQLQRHLSQPSIGHVIIEGSSQSRLAPSTEMTHSIRLVDETLQWCDNGMEMLQDQNDFLTIGVLGLQGSGKSTIQSLLAGHSPTDSNRNFVFRQQSKEKCEIGGHQTTGVDMFVTAERMVILDTQPVLSASVLDHMIHHDKKYPAEYSSAENCLEMQSLHLATFLLTVCNIVIVTMDWFTDVNLLRLLQTAEMLKPATPSISHEASSGHEDNPEFYPHIVFVLNKARRADFSVENFSSMQKTLQAVFHKSRLKYKVGVSLADGAVVPGLNPQSCPDEVNLFLLPNMDNSQDDCEGVLSLLPEFSGHPSFENLLKSLRNQIFSLPRCLLTHTTLSEKNWFHYAARTWEAVKKSTLLSEYNRLLA